MPPVPYPTFRDVTFDDQVDAKEKAPKVTSKDKKEFVWNRMTNFTREVSIIGIR